MKFASLAALALLAVAIGCGTTIETGAVDDRTPSDKNLSGSDVAVTSSLGNSVAKQKTPAGQTGGEAKRALENALATAKADSKNLLVHFGSPG